MLWFGATYIRGLTITLGNDNSASNVHQVGMPYGPLTRYVKFRVAHAPGMPGTFSPPQCFSDPAMHHGTCVTHVPWSMPGTLISSFLWSRWRGKRSRHSQRMRNPQFYVSGKTPIAFRFHWPSKSSLNIRTVFLGIGIPYIYLPGGRLNKKDGLSRYGDSHVKDKTS